LLVNKKALVPLFKGRVLRVTTFICWIFTDPASVGYSNKIIRIT